jgi:O-antigen/teichoic acid export membrane protein
MSETSGPSLRKLVWRGAAWSTLDVAVNRTLSFAMGVVVARLLTPEDFGVYAVALVVHVIIINVSEVGVSTALVRDDARAVEAGAPTVTTIALASSVALGTLMALSAPGLAGLLGAPDAASAIMVMALTLPLAGLSAVPAALLRRNFRMDRIFVAGFANTLGSAVVVIVLALSGFGPLALAWSYVAGQVLSTTLILVFAPARYRPGWDRQEARRLLRFGMPLAGANLLGFSIQNVDYVVVGRTLGSSPLGLYMLAFNICGWPANVFSSVIRSVSLPAFSRLRENGSDMPHQFSRVLAAVSRVTFPVCLFLAALAHPLILTVYGEQWASASAALFGLAIFAAIRTVTEVFSDFLVALGHTRTVLLVQVLWLPALTVALVVLVDRYGIAGAGAAHALVSSLIVLPAFVFAVRRAGVRVRLVARALIPSFSWAAVTAAIAWAVGGAAGLAVYVLPYLSDVRRALASERHRWSSDRRASVELPA